MLSRPIIPQGKTLDGADPAPSAQLVFVVLAAILIGALDAALVMFGIAGARGAFAFVPARVWVVAPLIWLVVAALAAVPVLLVTRRWSGLCLAATMAVVFLSIRLRAHPALLIVAIAGLALVLALLTPYLRPWMRRPRRRAAVGMLGLLGAVATMSAASPSASSMTSVPASEDDPNVIVIFLDTVRYDAVFDSDGGVHTELETLARLGRESTVFTRAYSTSSWTLPSHLSAVTGLPPQELGVSFDAQTYVGSEPTLAERFRQRGYRTAAVISNSFLNAGSGFARGFDIFQQAEAALDLCRTAPGLMADLHWPWFAAAVCNWSASEVTNRALRLMTDDERPFFLTLNYMDAHDPYYVERGCGGGRGYRDAVRCLDRQLASIVEWQSTRRSTVLALLSDHGELFGEHGLERHGNALFVQQLHVPMMIRHATSLEPPIDPEPISIAALPALLGVRGADAGPRGPIVALLHPPAAQNTPSEWSAIGTSWHLIVRERGLDALYHLPSDPAEEQNLIAKPPADPEIDPLRAAIAQMRRSPRPDAGRFRSLGYIH